MRSRLAIPVCAAGVLALSAAWGGTVFNGNTAPSGAHYSNGASQPQCSVDQSTLTVSCTGTSIAGVGNTDADLLLTVSYSATVQCKNHGGQIVDVKTQVTTSGGSNNDTSLKNGTLTVSPITLVGPSTQTLVSRATCPNGNWTKTLVDGTASVTAFSYTLTFQGFGQPAITLP